MRPFLALFCLLSLILILAGVVPQPDDSRRHRRQSVSKAEELGLPSETVIRLKAMHTVEGLAEDIAQFETVFWEEADSSTLRALLDSETVRGKTVFEIGTGSGLISLHCLAKGAASVVATDINPSAVANAYYNATVLGFVDRFDVRLVSTENPDAYAVLRPEEQFDLIVSNPPWEDGQPVEVADFAFYDTEFALLRSIFEGLDRRLAPGGRCLLVYGHKNAIYRAQQLADEYEYDVRLLDDRLLEDLQQDFLPGLTFEILRR